MLPEKILKTCLGWTPPLGGIQLKATDKGADALGFPVAPPQLGPTEECTSRDTGPSCRLKPEKQIHFKLNLLLTLAKVTFATMSLPFLQHICAIKFKCNPALYSTYRNLCTGLSCFIFFKIMRLDASHCTRKNSFISSSAPTPCLYLHLSNDALC